MMGFFFIFLFSYSTNYYSSTTMTAILNHPDLCSFDEEESSSGLSVGTIFLIIILALVVLYFVIGIPICYFVLHKRGVEIIPFVSFWKELPGLVKDGFLFIISPCYKPTQYPSM